MYRTLFRMADVLARIMALAGGAVLLLLIFFTCMSIFGRALVPLNIGLGPIRGIYDMTEIGMAAAIFAFLPWAHIREAHAKVDLFATAMPKAMDHILDLLFNTCMLVAAYFGTYRLYLGMQDKLSYGETTLIAQIPVWYGYALSLVGACGFVLIAAFCVLRSCRRLVGYEE